MVCPEKTVFENGLSGRNHFFHSEGLLSRQFIFQSLTESHKVPLALEPVPGDGAGGLSSASGLDGGQPAWRRTPRVNAQQ